jgi:GntR family negative regulator for fad regulon and positive regulator of fabA
MNWSAPQRPVDHAEQTLISAILNGEFLPGATLPAERELSAQLGVTRPTLREALRRLERDGWITIQQGKSTEVNDFWWEGGLNILSGIVHHSRSLPPDFITNLLRVRLDLAPSFTRLAIERAAERVVDVLRASETLDDDPEAFAEFDWLLQRRLTANSGNPVYALIFNSFDGFYEELARLYFAFSEARQASRDFYRDLWQAAQNRDGQKAEQITRAVMQFSIDMWQKANQK